MNKRSDRSIAVIGVGNEFRGDDAMGIIVARQIEQEKIPGVNVIMQSGEGTALIEAWQNADLVFLVDACLSNAETGKIFRFDVREKKLPGSFFNHSTHAFSVAGAIELARILDRLPPRLIVYAIEGKNFQTGADLSPEVEQATKKVCQRIKGEILK